MGIARKTLRVSRAEREINYFKLRIKPYKDFNMVITATDKHLVDGIDAIAESDSTQPSSMTPFLEGWLASESASHDSISVKRAYIDINGGNIHDGLIFSQIMYWHGRNAETGKPRLKVFKEGHYWLAKTYDDWWEECRIISRTAKACITRVKNRGLIITKIFKFNGMTTVHIRLNWEEFEKAVRHLMSIGLDIKCPSAKTLNVQALTETIKTKTTNKNYKNILNINKPPVSQTKTESCDRVNNFPFDLEDSLPIEPDAIANTGKAQKQVSIEKPLKSAIVFQLNDAGWLRMPRVKRYALARWLTIRRIEYQLATLFSNVTVATDGKGNTKTEGNQIVFNCEGKESLENEFFEDSPLLSLRDELNQKDMMSQDVFNNLLRSLFVQSVEWLESQLGKAKTMLAEKSPAFLFYNADRTLLNKLKQNH